MVLDLQPVVSLENILMILFSISTHKGECTSNANYIRLYRVRMFEAELSMP
jgi:hypothetical protein